MSTLENAVDETDIEESATTTNVDDGVAFEEEAVVDVETVEDTANDTTNEQTAQQKTDNESSDGSAEVDGVTKRINKLTKQKHDAIRAAEEERARREEVERKLALLQKDDDLQRVPEPVDPFDPDYAKVQDAREKAIAHNAVVNARKARAKEIELQAEQDKQRKLAETIQANVERMKKNVSVYGTDENTFNEAEKLVSTYVKSQEIAQYILEREDSTGIVLALAADSDLLDTLSEKSAGGVGAAIEFLITNVSEKAKSLVKSTTKTPKPAKEITADTTSERVDQMLDGLTLE